MRKKGNYSAWMYGLAIFAAAATLLAGCGDGSEAGGKAMSAEAGVVTAQPVLSDAERALYDYEQKYASGEFTAEDYQALAGIYAENGLIRKQRDMLEQSYRLYQDAQAFEALQTIAVNLSEEDAGAAEEAELLLQNLELPEYFGEAIHMLESKSWMDAMMPKLYEGKRSYFLGRDGQAVLSIQVGYDNTGEAFSHVWYLGTDGQVTYLHKVGSITEVLTTSLAEGVYDGAFDLWTLDGGTGNVYREQGTFAKGIFTGAYTMSVYNGTGAGSAFDLWNNRETFAYTTYTGNFDAEGKTTVEQPSEAKMEKLLQGSADAVTGVVYAYAENGKDCLFVPLKEGEDAAAYTFGAAAAGMEAYPAFPYYEVQENIDAENGNTGEAAAGTENTGEAGGTSAADAEGGKETDTSGISQIKVRIFDGEVQLYDGKKWVSAGSVNSLSAEDPFRTYAQQKEAYLAEQKQNAANAQNVENGQDTDRFLTGTIEEESKTPSANKPANKPSGNKPAENKPAQPAVPPTTSTTEPSTPTPDPAPNPDPTPNPDPEPSEPETPVTPGEGETDIEWSPDLM